jgi:Na+/melibiose symporter-like transporter
MTVLLRRLNLTRLALACIVVLGLVTAVAAIATVVWYFHSNMNFAGRTPWYGHVAYVAGGLAVVIPALACTVIAARAWARTSYLLMTDETDAAYEDEPEQPAEPESVS